VFKTILVAVDINDESSAKAVLSAAVKIGKDSGAELHVLGVVPDLEMPIVAQFFPDDFEKKAVDKAGQQLEALCAKNIPSGMSAKTHVGIGRVYNVIMSRANKVKADLIVVGAHDAGLQDYLVGSNARKVVAHAKQSVLVIRG